MSRHPETNPHFHPEPPHGTTIRPQPRRPKNQRPLPQHTPIPHFPIHDRPHYIHLQYPPNMPDTTFPFENYPDRSPQPQYNPTSHFPSHEPPHQHHPQSPPSMPGTTLPVKNYPDHSPQPQYNATPHFPLHEPPHHHHPQPPPGTNTYPIPTRLERNHPIKKHRREHSPQPTPSSLTMPSPHKTGAHTWLVGALCVLFWLAIILGGLIILVVYIVFRPRGPKFDISNVSLNAVYLDMGYLLNADMTILANFTNPSKKATVDFSHIELYLYYEKTLIASSYVKPFSALKADSRFRDIHLVSSQVWLPSRERERLRQQINNNRVRFEVTAHLHTRSNLGTIFRYSYRLYGHCIIELTGPPSGILRAKQCKTKR